jgi:hypothetical protein
MKEYRTVLPEAAVTPTLLRAVTVPVALPVTSTEAAPGQRSSSRVPIN